MNIIREIGRRSASVISNVVAFVLVSMLAASAIVLGLPMLAALCILIALLLWTCATMCLVTMTLANIFLPRDMINKLKKGMKMKTLEEMEEAMEDLK